MLHQQPVSEVGRLEPTGLDSSLSSPEPSKISPRPQIRPKPRQIHAALNPPLENLITLSPGNDDGRTRIPTVTPQNPSTVRSITPGDVEVSPDGNSYLATQRPIPPPRSGTGKDASKFPILWQPGRIDGRVPMSKPHLPDQSQFLSQQNLSEYDTRASGVVGGKPFVRERVDSASQVRGHPVAGRILFYFDEALEMFHSIYNCFLFCKGHRRSSSYGSTLDFKDYPTPDSVFLPPQFGHTPTSGMIGECEDSLIS